MAAAQCTHSQLSEKAGPQLAVGRDPAVCLNNRFPVLTLSVVSSVSPLLLWTHETPPRSLCRSVLVRRYICSFSLFVSSLGHLIQRNVNILLFSGRDMSNLDPHIYRIAFHPPMKCHIKYCLVVVSVTAVLVLVSATVGSVSNLLTTRPQ